MPVRVVFDCMVFLQGAARAEGPAGACLQLMDHEAITLCVSREILEEVREVLLRPKIHKKFSSLTPATIQAFLELVEQKGLVMETPAPAIANLRDPDDAPYLNLAIAAGAQFLVPRDKDLLDLMKDQGFTAAYPALKITEPASFLAELARTVDGS